MKKRIGLVVFSVVAASLFMVSGQAFAHHSAAGLFDSSAPQVTINGTVKDWLFVNPHPALILEVKTPSGVETWVAQFAGPGGLNSKFGWTRNTMKPGDTVKIIGYPFLTNKTDPPGSRKNVFPMKVTLADGKEYAVMPPRDASGDRGGSATFNVN